MKNDLNSDDEKIRTYFARYFDKIEPLPPDLLSSREIGFIPFGGSMVRHKRIMNREDLSSFLRRTVPRHFYYSTAYYKDPEIKKMDKKQWQGAELIFDLDADHLPGAEKLTYEEILSQVKKHTERLVFRYLMNEFGFTEKEISITFSGGRGYHVHVQSEKVYTLDSDARREIANYIRGEGLAQRSIIFEIRKQKNPTSGWFKQIDAAFTDLIRDLISGKPEARDFVDNCLGNKNSSKAFINALKGGAFTGRTLEKKESLFLKLGGKKYEVLDQRDEKVLLCVIRDVVQKESSEIDEPVTTDVHRLIRFPLSLHGKTGLAVKPVTLEQFKEFNPLRDAVPECFQRETEKISVRRELKISMNGENFHLNPGVREVPIYVAIFAVCIQAASFSLE